MADQQKGYILTESDRDAFRGIVKDLRAQPARITGRSGGAADDEEWLAPEVYVARTPSGGIPALDVGETGPGTVPAGDDEPGYADCDIYQLIDDNITYKLKPMDDFTQLVFNLSLSEIAGDSWILVQRDKLGYWFTSFGPSGTGDTIDIQVISDVCPTYGPSGTGGPVYGIRVERMTIRLPAGSEVISIECEEASDTCCPDPVFVPCWNTFVPRQLWLCVLDLNGFPAYCSCTNINGHDECVSFFSNPIPITYTGAGEPTVQTWAVTSTVGSPPTLTGVQLSFSILGGNTFDLGHCDDVPTDPLCCIHSNGNNFCKGYVEPLGLGGGADAPSVDFSVSTITPFYLVLRNYNAQSACGYTYVITEEPQNCGNCPTDTGTGTGTSTGSGGCLGVSTTPLCSCVDLVLTLTASDLVGFATCLLVDDSLTYVGSGNVWGGPYHGGGGTVLHYVIIMSNPPTLFVEHHGPADDCVLCGAITATYISHSCDPITGDFVEAIFSVSCANGGGGNITISTGP